MTACLVNMSVFTFETTKNNPVTTETIVGLAKEFGVEENEKDLEDYKTLLAVFHDSCVEIEQMEDYIPEVDYERFPRTNLHYPDPNTNKLNAWGYKCEIRDAKYAGNGVLDGLTVAAKDCIGIADVPMLLGTEFIQEYVPKTDATIITRLLEAGAVITGKAICENLCHSGGSNSAATGPVQNPLAIGYATGGSSSGSGALVMAGEVDISWGADQGGSVRIPAGWCGAFGLKPTFGLIPFTGCASNETSNDHLGVITRDVLTNARGLQAVAGSDGIDDRSFGAITTKYYDDLLAAKNPKSLKGMKIAILKEALESPVFEERIINSFKAAARKFEELGAIVEEVSIPIHSKATAIWTPFSKLGGYLTKVSGNTGRRGLALNDLNEKLRDSLHKQESWDKLYAASKNMYYSGLYAHKNFPGLYGKSMNLSRKLKDLYNKALEEYDLLIMPTLPSVARSHATEEASIIDLLKKEIGVGTNTAPFDQSGHPALAMPCGMLEILEGPLANSGTKLPVSLQLVGNWFDEKTVYKAAYAWEQSFNWREHI